MLCNYEIVKILLVSEEKDVCKMEKKGTNDGKLTFEIGTDSIKSGLDRAFKKNKNSIRVPGFRKGKVPRQISLRCMVKKHCTKML